MSVRKVLLDYSEYVRLLDIEQRFEKLSGHKEAVYQEGGGQATKKQGTSENDGNQGINKTLSSVLLNSEGVNEVHTPTLRALPSITYPPSATLNLSHKDQKEKKGNGKSVKKKKWYFLGVPS